MSEWPTLDRLRVQPLIDVAIEEDVGSGDVTTDWTVPTGRIARAHLVVKARGVLAGLPIVSWVFERIDPTIVVEVLMEEGRPVSPGDVVAEVRGPARGLLTGERTALNFLQRLSGVATTTARYVEAVKGTGARILDTRKTLPGWRLLDKYGVRVGGGTNHRMGLFDMVLLKENHIEAADGIGPAVYSARRSMSSSKREVKVEVEVRNLTELEEAMMAGVDWVMLDNMDLDTMAQAVRQVHHHGEPRPSIEASGNVNLKSVREIAETGVDFISVGSLTHSVSALDISMLFKPNGGSE